MQGFFKKFIAWLPPLDRRIWLLMAGRLLLQIGTGFVLFYAAIFFVNQVGLSATAVGIGIGSESISGIMGRILSGSMTDSPHWGRRKTLLISAVISAIADLVLVFSYDFPTFLLGNLLMGLGIGLYWPATESMVADLTPLHQRNEAFALTRLADSLGLGLGVIFGGWLIAATGQYRALFVIDGISFIVFFIIIYNTISETLTPHSQEQKLGQGWITAFNDRPLLIFVSVNVLLTTHLALINSALPLYLNSYVPIDGNAGFPPSLLSSLFAWYVAVVALSQLPIARWLWRFSHPQALIISALLWGISFILVWVTGMAGVGSLIWAMLALGFMALATATYNPSASSLVAGLAPETMRGVYLSINSLCWACGYFIGPTLGGWAMDQSRRFADGFWVGLALSVGGIILVLQYLDRLLAQKERVE